MKAKKIDIRKYGFQKVPRLPYMVLCDENAKEESRSCARVYIHLLFEASYIPRTEVCGRNVVYLKRGEMITTKKELARQMKQSRQNIDKTLGLLQGYGLLELEQHKRYTIFRVTDYDDISGTWEPLPTGMDRRRQKVRREVSGQQPEVLTSEETRRREEKKRKFEEWKRQHDTENEEL